MKGVSEMKKNTNIDNDTLQCEYCGTIKNEVIFVIGASNKPDWCMHEGTGKVSCPECYNKGQAEGQARIKKYIESHNRKAEGARA